MPSRRTDRDKETSMDLTPTGLHFDGCCLPCVTLYAQQHRNEYSIMLKLPSKSQCDFAKAAEPLEPMESETLHANEGHCHLEILPSVLVACVLYPESQQYTLM
nr:hypothetical protein Iba_chr06cCG10720 [Ipomoea batatas]